MSTEFLQITNLPANATRDLMTDADTGEADSRFISRPSRVSIAIEANAVGVELQIHSGQREIVPRSGLDAGGTTGVFPNLDQKAYINFLAAMGEKLKVRVRETAGVATTDIMGAINVVPIA